MGYHTNALFVRGASLENLAEHLPDILFIDDDEDNLIDYETASSGSLEPDCAAAVIKGWLVLWDPLGHLSRSERGEVFRAGLVGKGTALSVTMEGTTDSYGFRWITNGEVRRDLEYVESSTVVEDTGTALSEEANINLPEWGRDADWVFTVVERLTGLSWEDLECGQYRRVHF
jgi:hypothetical protein